MEDKTDQLKSLGSKETIYPDKPDLFILETFQNLFPDRQYVIELVCPEFTSLCPKTKQPDFAVIKIWYTPDQKCIETKSLKLYLFAFRNVGSFMETIVNKILDDLLSVCNPISMLVSGEFNARGGICLNVKASYERESEEE